MIDSERRKKLALHLRHLSVGLISNDTFENNLMYDVTKGRLPEQYRDKGAKFDDPIIIPMAQLSWGLYSDLKNYKLTGVYQLPDKSLKIIARCILFLHSEREFEWPNFETKRLTLKDYLLSVVTLGCHFRAKTLEQEQSYKEYQKLGDHEYWPFFKKDDYFFQLKNQPFLNPKNTPVKLQD